MRTFRELAVAGPQPDTSDEMNGIQQKSSLAHDVRRFSTADWIVAGTALFIICNGVSVCIGWWLRIPILVQLSPDAPTHFNTALIFILLGVGELGVVLGRRGVVMAMAVVVTCIASAELAEYALGLNVGIDMLFAVPFVGLDAPYPGRMSSNTIACFLLMCAAQVFISRPEKGAGGATTVAVTLKTLAGGIAFLAMLGYLVGLKSAYGWTDAVGMSIRSCAGFLLMFIARIAALWQRDIVDKPSLPRWFLPFLAISVVTISVGLIWIFASPLARPFMLDPLYEELAHRRSIAMLLSVGTLIVLGAISVLVARHKAVIALVSEKKLSSVLEHMSEGVMLIDTNGNAFYQNPASLRIHGLESGGTGFIKNQDLPISWKGWDEQGRPLKLDEWPLSRVARGERVQNQVLRARRCETNHEFFANYNGSPIYDDNGKIALSFISIQDITERRQAEGEVRESEERFRTLANSIPQLAWMARADGFMLWYNQRWHDYTGTTPAQMEGWGWQSVHDPAVLPTVLSRWRDAIALAQPFEMEFPLRGADGTFRNFLTRGQPMKDSEGRLVQWFGTCTDVDQLKRTEHSLRVTQARLESTLEGSSVGTWTWDIASDRLIADEFTARMFSIAASAAAEGLPAATYLQVVHEEDRTDVADALERAIRLCGAYDIEYRVRQDGGAFRWLQARGRVESDGAGNASYFHGAVIDITDRKLSELSLRDSASRIAGIVDTAMDAIITIDAAHRIVLFNPAAEWMFGYASTTLIGQPIDRLIPVRFGAAHAGHIRTFGQNGATSRRLGAVSGLRANGEEFPIEASISQIEIAGQKLLTVILRDVTERKQAEREIQESEQRFRSLFEYAPDGILMADSNGYYLDANPSICRLLGYTRSELIGLRPPDLREPAEAERVESALVDAKGGSALNHREWQLRRKDGSLVPVESVSAQLPGGELLGIIRDTTERREAQKALYQSHLTLEHRVIERTAQLEAANKELDAFSTAISHDLRVAEAADHVKSAFLATMSHELRTPLNSIIGFTAIVLQGLAGPLTPEQSKQLGMVQVSARHLLELINDVLDLSKIEAGQLEVRAELFDLRVALEHVTASITPLADKKGLALVTILSAQLGEIVSDRRRVEQIVINLLSNAVKFTERGSVTLTVTMVEAVRASLEASSRPAVRIQVADTGVGIKPADLATLFRPFRQIDSGLARENEGTGLGLAISQRLATLLGGEISAASEWAQGSTFTLTLPLTEASWS
jgi:PAS domain S-box-containing protein